jgi:phenylacetate-CoA ligase
MTPVPNADEQLGTTARQIAQMLESSLYWDAETLARYQELQLSQLIIHARKHSPFYSDTLNNIVEPDGAINWKAWKTLPTLKRTDLRDRAAALMSTTRPERHGAIHSSSSSGSTGVPITVHFPHLFVHVAGFAWTRFYRLHGCPPSDGQTYIKAPQLWPKNVKADSFEAVQSSSSFPEFNIRRDVSVTRKIELLSKSPYRKLVDSSNHAEILAHENLRQGQPVRLDFVVGIGMSVSEDQRAIIRESFGARCISPYSSKESGLIAFECPHGDHFHLCAELSFVEVLDINNRPVAPGQTGRCVVTPFFNSAQPLIRYEQGDMVRTFHGRCRGGITLPMIAEVIGRQDSIFRFPGVDVAPMGLDVKKVRSLLRADAFQFAQVGAREVEVRYLAQSDADSKDQEDVCNYFQKLIGVELNMRCRRVADIPTNAGGKQQRFAREYEA